MGDRGQLEQLLQNLIANALKFRRDGRARVWVRAEGAAHGMRQIAVADGGIGIAPEAARARLRDVPAPARPRGLRGHRHRAGRSAARSSSATAGRIWVDEREGGGTVFRFTLPGWVILRAMGDVAMPRLSDSMEEGTILKWLKSDGDEVSKGEELVEIETDKANMTYEADESGTLEIVAKEGDTLPVGETIAGSAKAAAVVRRRRGRRGRRGRGRGRRRRRRGRRRATRTTDDDDDETRTTTRPRATTPTTTRRRATTTPRTTRTTTKRGRRRRPATTTTTTRATPTPTSEDDADGDEDDGDPATTRPTTDEPRRRRGRRRRASA